MEEKKKTGKVIKIILILLAVFILCTFLLVMCSGGEEDETEVSDQKTSTSSQTGADTGKKVSGDKESILSDSAYGDPNTSWTVMLYLCGTDLETENGFATENLEEVCNADLDEKVNFVIEAGGTRKWKTGELSNGKLSRLHVEDGELCVDETCPSSSMGEAGTLKDFIKWGASNYPADRYMLVLWDHGGGSLFGICTDELHDGDGLTLNELEKALVDAQVPFEVTGFDACLMSTLETAEALQGYSRYMVASEETEPGTGWNYTSWLSYLSENKGCSGKDLGRSIVDSYMEKCADYDLDNMATLSVCDLAELPELSAAFRRYSGELVMTTQNETDFQAVVQGASKSESYGERSGEDGTYDMVDLGDLMNNTKSVLKETSSVVQKELADVVVYESHGRYRSKATGLSVFYPKYIDSDVYEAYESISDNTAYLEYASIMNDDWDAGYWDNTWMEAYEDYDSDEGSSGGFFDFFFNGGEDYSAYWEDEEDTETEDEDYEEEEDYEDYEEYEDDASSDSGQSSGGFMGGYFSADHGEDAVNLFQSLQPVQSGDEKLSFEQYLDDDNILNLQITSGLDRVKDVRFTMMYDNDGEDILYMGCDTDIYADYDSGEFNDNFRGTWITIGDEFVCAEVIDRTDEYDLYIIPAKVNGEDTFIRAVYDYDKEEFSVLGTYNGADPETNQSGRDIRPLKAGDEIDFIFYLFDLSDENEDADPEEVILGSIVWSDDTQMTDEEVGDGKFYYMFEIEDIFGNVTYCDPVIMEIEDGQISAYEIEE